MPDKGPTIVRIRFTTSLDRNRVLLSLGWRDGKRGVTYIARHDEEQAGKGRQVPGYGELERGRGGGQAGGLHHRPAQDPLQGAMRCKVQARFRVMQVREFGDKEGVLGRTRPLCMSTGAYTSKLRCYQSYLVLLMVYVSSSPPVYVGLRASAVIVRTWIGTLRHSPTSVSVRQRYTYKLHSARRQA